MSALEERIRNRETADLQNAIRKRLLSDEALPIAVTVLKERSEMVPAPEPIEALEAEEKAAYKSANMKWLMGLVALLILVYQLSKVDAVNNPEESQRIMHNLLLAGFFWVLAWYFKQRRK